MGISTVRKHKLLQHHRLSQFLKSTAWLHYIFGQILHRQSIVSWTRSGRAIHGEVGGLDTGRQHVQRFDLLSHSPKPSYPICANKRRKAQHRCRGGWSGPTLSVTQPGILFRRSIIWCTPDFSFRYFRKIENWFKAPVKILASLFHRGLWPLRPHSGCAAAHCSWQCYSRRLGRGESRTITRKFSIGGSAVVQVGCTLWNLIKTPPINSAS